MFLHSVWIRESVYNRNAIVMVRKSRNQFRVGFTHIIFAFLDGVFNGFFGQKATIKAYKKALEMHGVFFD